jgi:hypothetical protein
MFSANETVLGLWRLQCTKPLEVTAKVHFPPEFRQDGASVMCVACEAWFARCKTHLRWSAEVLG